MLKKFLRWSWLRPFARRILKKYGPEVAQELRRQIESKLQNFALPPDIQDRLKKLENLFRKEDRENLQSILIYLEMNPKINKELISILRKILNLLD